MVLFSQLLRVRCSSDEEFKARFPDAALVIEPLLEDGFIPGDTSPISTRIPEVEEELAERPAWEPRRDEVHPEAHVEWLIKSKRNPFTGFVTLGRARNNDIVVNSAGLSKIHLYFTRKEESWSVQDAGTSNGTVLDGEVLANPDPHDLRPGAALVVGGEVGLRFFSPEDLSMFCQLINAATPAG